MENLETTQASETQISVNNEMKDYLLETAKWGKFLAIVGYITLGLLILTSVILLVGSSALGSFIGNSFPLGILAFVYIVIAVLYFFPVTYLYRFSVQMESGIKSGDQQKVTSAAGNMKSMFKFVGIITIVVLSLYALIIVAAIVMSAIR